MRIYEGTYISDTTDQVVQVRDTDSGVVEALDPRLDLRNHSPTGLSWGYSGSGPAQLSLAMLCDALEDDELAQRVYQDFKYVLVSLLPQDKSWFISDTIVQAIANTLSRK